MRRRYWDEGGAGENAPRAGRGPSAAGPRRCAAPRKLSRFGDEASLFKGYCGKGGKRIEHMKDSLADRLENCYTGAVFDVLHAMGRENQVLPASIRPLDPTRKLDRKSVV